MAALHEASIRLPKEDRPWLIHFREGKGIVRCSHVAKEEVIEALRSISSIGSREVTLRTLGTSGTVRGAMEKYIEPLRGDE